jgi:diguanylate cyclase (GGDEF)-like protein
MLRNAPELVFLYSIPSPAITAGLVIAAGVVGSLAAALAARKNANQLRSKLDEQSAALDDAEARLQQASLQRDLAQQELNLQNDHMVQELRERSRRAGLLARLAQMLQCCADLNEAFQVVAGLAPKLFPKFRGALMLLDSSRQQMEVVGTWSDCERDNYALDSQSCWALRTGRAHYVEAGDHTAECGHFRPLHRSYLCVPILAQGEAFGILHFQGMDKRVIADSEISLATNFADQVGLAVANIRLREALRSQSIRDPLTGLYNRRYLDETLEREVRRAGRSDHAVSILMLDIDHFKRFNDTNGHDAGDTVLRETSTLISASIRSEDIACRFGGEEFVVVLPTATVEVAQARAERLRLRLHDLSPLHQGRPLGRVTASIGVAEFPRHGLTPKDLLTAADAALYQAKNGGRDLVVVAPPLSPQETGSSSSLDGNWKTANP